MRKMIEFDAADYLDSEDMIGECLNLALAASNATLLHEANDYMTQAMALGVHMQAQPLAR